MLKQVQEHAYCGLATHCAHTPEPARQSASIIRAAHLTSAGCETSEVNAGAVRCLKFASQTQYGMSMRGMRGSCSKTLLVRKYGKFELPACSRPTPIYVYSAGLPVNLDAAALTVSFGLGPDGGPCLGMTEMAGNSQNNCDQGLINRIV